LVTDDEPAVLTLVETMLRHGGFNVWTAVHGYQAVDQYRRLQGQLDLVLLDVFMPGLNGPQTLFTIQQIDPAVRCCFMTGTPQPYTEEGLLQIGALRVFRKPFALGEFLPALEELAANAI
jgi:CheY-like chemotaxis protein